MDKSNKPLFMHMRNLKVARKPPAFISLDKFTLENVAAYNVDVDIGDMKTSSIVTLREVPSFLIEAFTKLGNLDGCQMEGIFRKEGNSGRTKEGCLPVFFGAQPIPANFLVHDVCCWIKRFFRDLRSPLFDGRENQLLKFADTFSSIDDRSKLFGLIINLLDRMPSANMGALGYLMRCLQEISEQSSIHHMTIENLATVFAPSIFRLQPDAGVKKKRNRSDDNLLTEMKRMNELKVLIVHVLIENAEKIGVAKDIYKASRRPSDLKKKEKGLIASSIQRHAEGRPPIYEYSNEIQKTPYLRSSQSTSNLDQMAAATSLLSKQISEGGNIKKKQQRSNSVVRAFGAFKNNFFKKSLSNIPHDGYLDSPDIPGLAMKHIPKQKQKDITPMKQPTGRISMDPSPNIEINRIARLENNLSSKIDLQMIKHIMSPKDKKKRAPIPVFDVPFSSSDEKKENISFDSTDFKDSANVSNCKKPMGHSNVVNVCRNASQMYRRIEPLRIDRERRHTAPVNQGLKRNQPNTLASGLNTLSKGSRIIRRSSSKRSANIQSSSSEEEFVEKFNKIDTRDVLEQKGLDARRRRKLKKKSNESLTNLLMDQTVIKLSNERIDHVQSHKFASVTPYVDKHMKNSETSDAALTSDLSSSDESKRPKHTQALYSGPTKSYPKLSSGLSVDVRVTKEKSIPQVTPSPDSGCSSISSKHLNLHSDAIFIKSKEPVFVVPKMPTYPRSHGSSKVEIRPTGTSIMLPTTSSLAKRRSPVKRTATPTKMGSFNSSIGSRRVSKSPGRTALGLDIQQSLLADFDDTYGRPSLVSIQKTGMVNQRIQQFKNLLNAQQSTLGNIHESDEAKSKPVTVKRYV